MDYLSETIPACILNDVIRELEVRIKDQAAVFHHLLFPVVKEPPTGIYTYNPTVVYYPPALINDYELIKELRKKANRPELLQSKPTTLRYRAKCSGIPLPKIDLYFTLLKELGFNVGNNDTVSGGITPHKSYLEIKDLFDACLNLSTSITEDLNSYKNMIYRQHNPGFYKRKRADSLGRGI